jgi:hypothetical protein
MRTRAEMASVQTLAIAVRAMQAGCGSISPVTAAVAHAPTDSIMEDTAGTDNSWSTCQVCSSDKSCTHTVMSAVGLSLQRER